VKQGLLYYTQSEEVVSVEAARGEVRGLVGVRNGLAEWGGRRGRGWERSRKEEAERKRKEWEARVRDGVAKVEVIDEKEEVDGEEKEKEVKDMEEFLPPPIDDERVCTRCYAADACMLFRRVRHLFLFTRSKFHSCALNNRLQTFLPQNHAKLRKITTRSRWRNYTVKRQDT
jgi:DNA replication ATP-dependent helicase Dna2